MTLMIRKVTVFVLFFVALFAASAPADENKALTIIYTGNINGKLMPTQMCGGVHAGGFSRRAKMLEDIKETNKNVLMVDSGGLFAVPARQDQELRARQAFEIYDFLGLDALNLGQREFYFGAQYLADASQKVSFSFISSNIKSETPQTWLKPYVIKEIGGFRAAIVGVLPENSFDFYVDPEKVKGFTIISAQDALKELVPQLKEKSDIIVLLSQFDMEETAALVNGVPGINLAVTTSDQSINEAPLEQDKVIVPTGVKGQFFLSVNVTKEDGKLVIRQNDPVALDKADQHNVMVDQMIADSNRENMQAIRAKKKQEASAVKATVPVYNSVEEFNQKIKEQRQDLIKQSGEPEGEEIKAKLKYNGQEIPAKITVIHKKDQTTKTDDTSASEQPADGSEKPADAPATEGDLK